MTNDSEEADGYVEEIKRELRDLGVDDKLIVRDETDNSDNSE